MRRWVTTRTPSQADAPRRGSIGTAIASFGLRSGIWLLAPALTATVVVGLILSVPTSGHAVEIRWRDTVSPASQRFFERRLQLANRTQIDDTRWGYVLDNLSPSHLALFDLLSKIETTAFVIGPPYRASGPLILRRVGPLTAPSLVCLAIALLVAVGSAAPTVSWRKLYLAVAAGLLLAAWVACELPIRAGHTTGEWMGDYGTYTEDRGRFETFFGYDSVRFHFHLGGFVLNGIDRALGQTPSSPRTAFLVLSWLAGVVFLIEVWVAAIVSGWSPRVMRYVSLCLAAPATLMFFGYRELGYLSLSVAGFPLLAHGLSTSEGSVRTGYLSAAATLQGLRSALHGFGLVSLAGSLLAALTPAGRPRTRLTRAGTVFVCGFTAYLIWLLAYLLVLGLPIVPGHASGIPFRHPFTPYAAEHRIVDPIASARGMRDIAVVSVVTGMPVLIAGLVAARRRREERHIAAAFVLPSLIFLVFFWPAQGIGVDVDGVLAAGAGFFAGAWLCATSPRATATGLGLLVAAHVLFWRVVTDIAFTNLRVLP